MHILNVQHPFQAQLARWLNSERCYQWLVIGILGLGLTLRLMGLGKGVWLDEASSLNRIFSQGFLQELRFSDHPPLYYVLLKTWSQMNRSEEFLRVLSVCFGLGTIVVVMKWLKQYSLLSSLIAGLLCATLPMMLRYSQELKGYSLLLFATAISFYCADQLTRHPERSAGYLGLGAALTVAVATHAVGVMLLPSICAFIVLTFPTWRKIRPGRTILALAVPTGVFIFLFSFFLADANKDPDSWWMPPISLDLITQEGIQIFGINQARLPFWVIGNRFPASANSLETVMEHKWDAMVLMTLGIGSLVWSKWKLSAPLFVAALSFWLAIISYSILFLPIFIDRTLMPGLIPFIGFVGLHIGTMPVRKVRVLLSLGVVFMCFIFAVNWVKNEAGKPIENWRQLAQVLDETRLPGDLIIAHPEFVPIPLGYYVELPDETTVPVGFEANGSQVGVEIRSKLNDIKNTKDSFSVFLVARASLDVQQRPETLQGLQVYLRSELGAPALSIENGGLLLQKYEFHRPGS